MDTPTDLPQLKYVIYARKSTDDPQRQVRSTKDQIDECWLLANRMHLKVVDTITEKKSAKKPGKRPLFRKMLDDIQKGIIDGIIAWHPDRLSRNMKEGGEIIDMVDENYIKDMQFVMHHFSKDANGKMLLGMAFVLSKQYSDNLSQNVTRGVRKSFKEGKSPAPKHGYIRDENGLYQPDGKNFELICQAWLMRKDGISLVEITTFMNSSGYGRVVKTTGKLVKMTNQILSDLFKDPFYYGILLQAGKETDLRAIYAFTCAITQKDYIDVQVLSGRRINPYRGKRHTFLPLKMMVSCAFCGNHMYAGVSKGHTKKYLFYRCDNQFCPRKKKSVRAIVVFDFIYKFLADGLNFTEKDYEKYYGGLTKITEARRQKLEHDIYSKESILRSTRGQIKDTSLKLLDNPNLPDVAKQIGGERLEELQHTEQELAAEIAKLKQKVIDPEIEKISIEQFLNLSKNAAQTVKAGDEVLKDVVCRLIFLNFSVDEEKVASYQLKPPFDELLKTRSLVSSRGDRARTCGLTVPNRTL